MFFNVQTKCKDDRYIIYNFDLVSLFDKITNEILKKIRNNHLELQSNTVVLNKKSIIKFNVSTYLFMHMTNAYIFYFNKTCIGLSTVTFVWLIKTQFKKS